MASIVIAPFTGVAKLFGLGPTELPTQRLGEIAQQTAKEGEPRLIVYGIVRPIGGNLVAVQEPPRIERRKQKSGGKGGGGGGGGSSQTVEIPRRTYAIGICEGPITGIRRVWRNNKLVYDGRGTSWGARNNGTFLQRFRFYLGGWDQMPDPSLEAVFGVGTVPAMRGTCYMLARDEDLQDTGGAVPQWIFEVERAYGYGLTSRPYPIQDIQGADSTGGAVVKESGDFVSFESLNASGGAVVGGEFRATLFGIDAPESLDSSGGAVVSGEFRAQLIGYTNGLPESLDSSGGAVTGGIFRAGLITYTEWPVESLDATGGAVIGGSHGTS